MKADLLEVRAFFAAAPFMVDLGIEPTAVGEGMLSTAMAVQPRHLQHTGQVHAGVSASLADHTMGAAAQMLAPAGRNAITVELKTSLLRPATGSRLMCEARVVKAGRSLSFTEAQVFDERDGQRILVATASATMAMVPVAA